MAVNLANEQTLTLAQAAKLLPPGRQGRPMHFSAVLRWVLSGCKGPDGRRVHLEALRLGGRWLTSVEAIQRFAEKLTPSPTVDDAAPRIRYAAASGKASERAAAELEKLGI